MSQHPVNLALRFLLELLALAGIGAGGWSRLDGPWRWLATLGVPLIAATVWGVFRVPGDPKEATIAVPGLARLAIEAAFFAAATWGFWVAAPGWLPIAFGVAVLVHYAASYDRVRWLLER